MAVLVYKIIIIMQEKKDDSDHEDGSEVHVSDPEDEDKTNEVANINVKIYNHIASK